MSRVCLSLMLIAACFVPAFADETPVKPKVEAKAEPKLEVGQQAPEFKIKDAAGKIIDLTELTKKGPVLVRLTCGCSGCDKELAYFKEIDAAYKDQGLTSLLIFKEPDTKVAKYAVEKKLSMLYAVDTKGDSWKTFKTTSMPTNFLIEKGGKIFSIANGCDPSGLLANKVSEKAAKVVGGTTVDVQKEANKKPAETAPEKKEEAKTEKK